MPLMWVFVFCGEEEEKAQLDERDDEDRVCQWDGRCSFNASVYGQV